jgi:hypothetical protein
VTPTTPLARTLAWMEAVAGQFCLALLVAGIVGFKITQAMKDGPALPVAMKLRQKIRVATAIKQTTYVVDCKLFDAIV